ncbi:peptidoglycan DD-metalloendopeptidase family protein [Clostridium rectalis]|uniref:peptidoglycan DD-metalloendopeptidase family protein n=1 Tax=Clostridium rectalis TaxID=2040295 RepID=UPI000F6394E2|nr:peptidoglycan DD-metalloendopeptidase family protein [Clostridium rectalis]
MGSYNSQYEDYYRNLRRKRERSSYNMNSLNKKKSSNNSNYLVKRIIRDLSGAVVLFFIVIICRLIVTPQTQAVYNYSKKIVEKSYDYNAIYAKVKTLNISKFQDKATDFIENIKAKVTGGRTIKEKVKAEFTMPVKGNITSNYGYREDPVTKSKKFHEGIDIDVKENTDIKVVYDGKVKDCGEDVELGKYVLIDHGQGIETKYAHLNELSIKKGDELKKGSIIGKSGNTGKSTGPHLHFELLYMGESKNPSEFIAIK